MDTQTKDRPVSRGLVERYPRIDLADWRRQGLLEPQTLFFLALPPDYGGKTTRQGVVSVEQAQTRLSFPRRPGVAESEVEVVVPLERVACPFGGQRVYFDCLGCRRRTTALYFRDDRWLCRRCQNLGYRSQRRSALERAADRARRARFRAGADPDLSRPFEPRRPRGMRRSRFERLCAAVAAAERTLTVLQGREVEVARRRLARLETMRAAVDEAMVPPEGENLGTPTPCARA